MCITRPSACRRRWEPGPAQLRRQSVARRAQDLIGGDCLTLDTETTGLGDDAEICEITILDVTGAPILDTLVRPTRPIPVEATAIHKITDAMVASAPSWPEVAEQYAAAVAGRTVVAYDVAFDARLLRQTYQIHGLTAPVLTTACAHADVCRVAWRVRPEPRPLAMVEADRGCDRLRRGRRRRTPRPCRRPHDAGCAAILAAPHERTATGRAESGHRPAGGFAPCFRMKLYFKE
ncbi:3'-5' exonuclease DinG [Stutzerimonas stutzeri]